jgi:hypothetical protein
MSLYAGFLCLTSAKNDSPSARVGGIISAIDSLQQKTFEDACIASPQRVIAASRSGLSTY